MNNIVSVIDMLITSVVHRTVMYARFKRAQIIVSPVVPRK